MELARDQRFDEALALLDEAIRAGSELGRAQDVVRLCSAAGVLCGHSGKLRDAARYYEQAARLVPDDPYLQFALGDAYAALGDEPRCAVHWDRFVQIASASADPAVQDMLTAHLTRRQSKP